MVLSDFSQGNMMSQDIGLSRTSGDFANLQMINAPRKGAASPTMQLREIHSKMLACSIEELDLWERVLAEIIKNPLDDIASKLYIRKT